MTVRFSTSSRWITFQINLCLIFQLKLQQQQQLDENTQRCIKNRGSCRNLCDEADNQQLFVTFLASPSSMSLETSTYKTSLCEKSKKSWNTFYLNRISLFSAQLIIFIDELRLKLSLFSTNRKNCSRSFKWFYSGPTFLLSF